MLSPLSWYHHAGPGQHPPVL